MFSEEEDNAVLNSRKNLASIFNSDVTEFDVPPSVAKQKQINTSSNSMSSSENSQASSVIIVKVVQCFVYENSSYKSQGRVGAAITRGDTAVDYGLILYKDKTKPITKAQITAKFWFNLQPSFADTTNIYATFYDIRNVLWSILFDSSTDIISFSIEIALARWSSGGPHNGIISQDLLISKADEKIKEGDRVNITYIAWPFLPSNKINKEIESKGTLTTKLSSGKHWENSLLGIVDGGKRALIIPALLLDDWERTIGRRCPDGLFLQITVDKCSLAEDHSVAELVLPSLPSDGKSDGKKKDRSTFRIKRDESLKSKQDLISRLGKLGKLLPTPGSKFKDADSDETEEDSSSAPSDSVKPLKPKRELHKVKSKHSIQTIVPKSPSLHENQMMIMPAVNYPMVTSLNSIALSPIDPQISAFLSDQRSHNAEMRLGLMGATNKLDELIEKVSSKSLAKLIDHIQRTEEIMISQLSSVIGKTTDLDPTVISNQRRFPEAGFDKRDKGTLEELETENNRIRKLLSEENIVINNLKAEIDNLTSYKQKLEAKLVEEQIATKELEKEKIARIKNLDSMVNNPYKFVHDIESSIEMWTSKVQSLENILDGMIVESRQNESDDNSMESDQVMEVMNSLYKLLKSKFKDDDEFDVALVRSIFSSVFKDMGLENDDLTCNDDRRENDILYSETQLEYQPSSITSSTPSSRVPPPVPDFDEVTTEDDKY